LDDGARAFVDDTLDQFGDWDRPSIEVLRNLALSLARLDTLQRAPDPDVRQIHRELRAAVALYRALDLEPR
jgi:hypothetical protein